MEEYGRIWYNVVRHDTVTIPSKRFTHRQESASLCVLCTFHAGLSISKQLDTTILRFVPHNAGR